MKTIQTIMSSLSIVLNNATFTVFKAAVKRFNCAVIKTYHQQE